jgi:hypothetical protein
MEFSWADPKGISRLIRPLSFQGEPGQSESACRNETQLEKLV